MERSCLQCSNSFEVTDPDQVFYKKIDVPSPTLCPDCRQQRRLTYRNERHFYVRQCDLTGKEIVSIYASDAPAVVYAQDVWWGDSWDPLTTGKDFDFGKPFFEQFTELGKVAPRPCIMNMASENSIYTNHSGYNKDCYMCIDTGFSEDLMYCANYTVHNKDCVDCLAVQKCELCYFCSDTRESSSSAFLHECTGCSECFFSYDCRNCTNCFGCWNLRNKQYCIFNKQYSKEEYEQQLQKLMPRTWNGLMQTWQEHRAEVAQKAIHRALYMLQCEDSTGDHLWNTRNVKDSYFVFESEDATYCYDAGYLKDCVDTIEPYKGELQYEANGCNYGVRIIGCSKCYECTDTSYSQYCFSSSNLFGCFGLKRKQYCIFNKQYSKEDYESLKQKIITHMKKTGEWGEFFPAAHASFAYNETVANEYYPLTKEDALKRGWRWRDPDARHFAQQTYAVPDIITDASDDITEAVLACEQCSKNYRIIPQELAFYRKRGLPVPRWCFDCRHSARMTLRNPRRLWERACMQCGTVIKSSYAPERLEKVYCEECYLKAVY